jgi:clan AA aspartic protease
VNGNVDSAGRALVLLRVWSSEDAEPIELTVWIDTAFTGELVIPRERIEALGLPQSAAVLAGLADGRKVVLDSYSCLVDWFGEPRLVEVIANEGQFPLLGVGLLREHRLKIDYRSRTLVID